MKGMNTEHFDLWISLWSASLKEAKVSREVRKEALEKCMSLKKHILIGRLADGLDDSHGKRYCKKMAF